MCILRSHTPGAIHFLNSVCYFGSVNGIYVFLQLAGILNTLSTAKLMLYIVCTEDEQEKFGIRWQRGNCEFGNVRQILQMVQILTEPFGLRSTKVVIDFHKGSLDFNLKNGNQESCWVMHWNVILTSLDTHISKHNCVMSHLKIAGWNCRHVSEGDNRCSLTRGATRLPIFKLLESCCYRFR